MSHNINPQIYAVANQLKSGKSIYIKFHGECFKVCQSEYIISDNGHIKNLIILANHVDQILSFFPKIHPRVETLLQYLERPLTIQMKKPYFLPNNIKPEFCGVQICKNETLYSIIDLCGSPLMLTNAPVEMRPSFEYCYDQKPKIAHYDKEGFLSFSDELL